MSEANLLKIQLSVFVCVMLHTKEEENGAGSNKFPKQTRNRSETDPKQIRNSSKTVVSDCHHGILSTSVFVFDRTCVCCDMSGGESAYSFSLTTFSPSGKLHQIEYAMNAVNNGYSALGIRGKLPRG